MAKGGLEQSILAKLLCLPAIAVDQARAVKSIGLDPNHPRLSGVFDLCYMPQIAILDYAAERLLARLSERSLQEILANLYDDGNRALLGTADNSLEFIDMLSAHAAKQGIWVGRTSALAPHAIEQLDSSRMKQSIIHGVMMDVYGIGVLMTGDSGLGKSELALELISRGHVLVADDAPIIRRTDRNALDAICPPILQDFLEIRGLGLLNIAKMFGQAKVRYQKRLDINLHLLKATRPVLAQIDRIVGQSEKLEILSLSVPKIVVPVAPGRNLSVIVEAAVRNFRLQRSGYDAVADIGERQISAQNRNKPCDSS